MRPEVSELSDAGAVTINSIKVPSLRVRRAETTVELASGQSFAIAGLFQNNVSNSVKHFPVAGRCSGSGRAVPLHVHSSATKASL